MRKFALLPLFAGLAFAQGAFAQVRDLFAEFEEEAAASSAAEVPASSLAEVSASSSSVAPASSAAVSSSVAVSSSAESSSSVAVSSSSVALSSSVELSSSSFVAPPDRGPVVPADSAKTDSAAVVPVDSAAVLSDSATVAPADSSIAVADSAAVDSLAASSSSATADSLASSSSAVSSSSVQVAEPVVIPSSSSMSRRDLLGPVKISKVNGIDEMKGRYKSPRKALFMSLVVPGSGQLFVGGSTFTYVRGGVYLALEAALWGSWYYFSVHKYNDQVDKYKKFARNHYSIGRYEVKMRNLYKQLADETEESRFENRYMSSREGFCEALYGSADSYGCYVKGQLFQNDKNHLNKFKDQKALGKEIDGLKDVYDVSTIYQQIADDSYVLGWDDVEDETVVLNLELETDSPENGTVSLASSNNKDEYRSMRGKANDYADMQAWFFGGIILNHLVSAVDAAFTARSHNKALYSEDVSWYDRLHFDSYMSFADGFDVGAQASWGF